MKKVTIKVQGFDTPELGGSRSRNIVSPSPSMLKMLVIIEKNHSQSIATVASGMEFEALGSGTVLIPAPAATANIFSNYTSPNFEEII